MYKWAKYVDTRVQMHVHTGARNVILSLFGAGVYNVLGSRNETWTWYFSILKWGMANELSIHFIELAICCWWAMLVSMIDQSWRLKSTTEPREHWDVLRGSVLACNRQYCNLLRENIHMQNNCIKWGHTGSIQPYAKCVKNAMHSFNYESSIVCTLSKCK